MKFLTIIFSFYLLFLPLLPCMDDAACENISSITAISTATHTDHNNSEETCNPFCNCVCCGQLATPVFYHVKTSTAKNIDAFTIHSFYQNISVPSDFFGNIWQPPKLVG